MEQKRNILIILTAAVFGFVTAFAISATFYRADLNSLSEWGVALSLLTLGFGMLYFLLLPGAWGRFLGAPTGIKLWGIILSIFSAVFFSLFSGIGFLPLFILAGFVITSHTLSSLHDISKETGPLLFITAWVLAGLTAFFTVGFFKNFYPGLPQFVLLTVFFGTLFTVLFASLLEKIAQSIRNDPREKIIPITVLLLGIVFIFLTVLLLIRYPNYFTPAFFLPVPSLTPVFFGLLFLCQGAAAFTIQKFNLQRWLSSPFFDWVNRNLPGLVLAFSISISTFLLETALVRYDLAFMDVFFQIDSPWWLDYLTFPVDQMRIMRFVHPFVLLLLRPPVWFISLFLQGDKYHATLLLNAAFGGVCVFLTWLYFKKRTGRTAYALLIAALLGFSNAHLVLSSFLETYIFSAAALIAFFMLAQSDKSKFWHLVLAGLVTFGITVTNFIQTCIDVLVIRPDRKIIFKYVLYVLSLGVLLAFAQNIMYPNSDPLYLTDRYKSEQGNMKNYADMTTEQIVYHLTSRANVMFRNTFLFSVVAPRPIIHSEEIICDPVCFRVMRPYRGGYRYASYVGFGSLLARVWFLGWIMAFVIFLWQFIKSPKQVILQIALLLNILFNYALHMRYGDDPLLYTPDWTYALVFFFGISFERWKDNKLLQILLLVFLTGLAINNLDLFSKIFQTLLQFFP